MRDDKLYSLFKLFDDGAMEFVTKIFHGAAIRLEDDGRVVVGQLTLGFRVTVTNNHNHNM